MSFLEVNRLTPKSKILSGCGDGITLEPQAKVSKRIPVPSCRRFATRPQAEETNVKEKLEQAITELQTPKKQRKPRRKSFTMAEITPTKRKPKSNSLDGFMSDVDSAAGEVRTATRRSEIDAGRRLYKVLLLNAWRRSRLEVVTLSESLKQVKLQNQQLQLQADVLQKLRESECKRRDQTTTENNALKEEVHNLLNKNSALTEDKVALEKQVSLLDENIEQLKTEIENTKNEFMDKKAEIKALEDMLQKERNKLKNIREDVRLLTGKFIEAEKDILVKRETIRNLKESMLIMERNIEDVRLQKNQQEQINETLKSDVMEEKNINSKLNNKLKELTAEKAKLENEILLFQEKLNTCIEDNEKLKTSNQTLKIQTQMLKLSLIQERNKPWWMITRDVFKIPLALFKTAAFTMLPALPPPDNRNSKSIKSTYKKNKQKNEKTKL